MGIGTGRQVAVRGGWGDNVSGGGTTMDMNTVTQIFGLVLVAVGIAMLIGGIIGLIRWAQK